jgi:hypothetical protein
MTDRKKTGVAFWATVVLVAVLAYPLSFGPACWIASRTESCNVSDFYLPLGRMIFNSSITVRRPALAYAKCGISPDTRSVTVPIGDGKCMAIIRD